MLKSKLLLSRVRTTSLLVPLLVSFLFVGPLLAYTSTLPITVKNNYSRSLQPEAVVVPLNSSALASSGFLTPSLLHSSLLEGTTAIPYFLSSDYLVYKSNGFSSNQERFYNLNLSTTSPRDNFDLLVPTTSVVSIPDHADLEPGSGDFAFLYEGYIDFSRPFAPEYVGESSGIHSGSTSVDVVLIGGIQEGDTLVLWATARYERVITLTGLGGWENLVDSDYSSTSGITHSIYYKVASAGESGTVTVNVNTSTSIRSYLYVFRGAVGVPEVGPVKISSSLMSSRPDSYTPSFSPGGSTYLGLMTASHTIDGYPGDLTMVTSGGYTGLYTSAGYVRLPTRNSYQTGAWSHSTTSRNWQSYYVVIPGNGCIVSKAYQTNAASGFSDNVSLYVSEKGTITGLIRATGTVITRTGGSGTLASGYYTLYFLRTGGTLYLNLWNNNVSPPVQVVSESIASTHSINNTTNIWYVLGGCYFPQSFKIHRYAGDILEYDNVTSLNLNLTLTNLISSSHIGTLLLSTTPGSYSISLGGVKDSSSFVPPSVEEGSLPEVLPGSPISSIREPSLHDPGDPDPMESMVWYDLFLPAAQSLQWATVTLYQVMSLFVAIAVGVGVVVATGSALLGIIGVGFIMGIAIGAEVLGTWVLLVFAIFTVTFLLATRSV